MNKKNLLFIFVLPVLLLASLACSLTNAIANATERGEITFVTPSENDKFYTYDTGQIPYTGVSIRSTYDTDKQAEIRPNSSTVSYPCRLKANDVSPCGEIPYQKGFNTLEAQVMKRDGITPVTTKITFNWTPPSPLDHTMATFASYVVGPNATPSNGYGMVGILVYLIATLILIKSGKLGVVTILIVGLVFLSVYSYQTGSVVITIAVLKGIFGVIGSTYVFMCVYAWIKTRHTFVITRADGTKMIYSGPGGEKGAHVINAIGMNADKLIPPPRQYPPGQGVQYQQIPARGIAGYVGRLLRQNDVIDAETSDQE